jgi:hypothetical protein
MGRSLFSLLGAIGAALVFGISVASAQMETDSAESPERDEDAITAALEMGQYLRSLNSFELTAHVLRDNVMDDGQLIQRDEMVKGYYMRPDKLRVDWTSAAEERQFYYDGKTASLFGPRVGYYAQVPAPGTVGQTLAYLEEEYDFKVPLSDMFAWGTDEEDVAKITSAIAVGQSRVGHRVCDHYAFRQEDFDWQIWIESGGRPLPCKVNIVDLSDGDRPQYTAIFFWALDVEHPTAIFDFSPPFDAARIEILKSGAASEEPTDDDSDEPSETDSDEPAE